MEETEWERLQISSRKLEILREYFMQVQFSSVAQSCLTHESQHDGHNKGQKWYGPNRSKNTQNNSTKKIFMTQIIMMVCSLT